MVGVQLDIHPGLYLRDPQQTELGRSIVRNSIALIAEIGFEHFTFKKLADHINSTEASIYRYFENKHLLLVYLLNWYWEWMSFSIDMNVTNISDPKEKLSIAIASIVDTARRNTAVEFVDEDLLHRIVVAEGVKAYHTISVDEENKEGFFLAYKSLCRKIADIVLELNPEFPYPRALASSLLELANSHLYFSEHLPRLTDIAFKEGYAQEVQEMLQFFAFKLVIDRPGAAQ